jgi:hypothetical protein
VWNRDREWKPAGLAVRNSFRAWREESRLGEYKDAMPQNFFSLLQVSEPSADDLFLLEDSELFGHSHVSAIYGRLLFITEGKKVGISIEGVQKGDLVCLILGTNVPFILRKLKDNYMPIGEAYCHGLMNGEGMEDLEEGKIITLSIV